MSIDAAILAFRIDQLDFADANIPVGAGSLLLRNRGGFHGTTNGVFSLARVWKTGSGALGVLKAAAAALGPLQNSEKHFGYSKNPRDRNHEDQPR